MIVRLWEVLTTEHIIPTDMKRILLAFYAVLLAAAVEAQTQPTNLIPAPAEYSALSGSISANKMASLHEKVRISQKALLRRLEGRRLADWQLKSAYWLELGKKGVKIVAADEEGVFYARQTLKMMASLDSPVSCCSILDWPRFRYRGVMLDESRHFQGMDFEKKQLEMMALLKMNRFHFHLVDNPGWRVQIDAYPRLTQLTAWRPQAFFWDWEKNEIGGPFVEESTPGAYGGYYSKQDIAEILAFADERHIEVIPEIEMPGHNYETLIQNWLAVCRMVGKTLGNFARERRALSSSWRKCCWRFSTCSPHRTFILVGTRHARTTGNFVRTVRLG